MRKDATQSRPYLNTGGCDDIASVRGRTCVEPVRITDHFDIRLLTDVIAITIPAEGTRTKECISVIKKLTKYPKKGTGFLKKGKQKGVFMWS
jgi:hypothetical protein